jgi:hypothetical protein
VYSSSPKLWPAPSVRHQRDAYRASNSGLCNPRPAGVAATSPPNCVQAPGGDATFRFRLSSLGPTAVSASSISRFFGLGGSSAGGAVTCSIVPSISLTERPAWRCKRGLDVFDHVLKLLVRQVLERIAVLDLVLARDQHGDNFQPGCSRRTFAMAFSPCREKSLSNAQITASLSLLREPRTRPTGFPGDRADAHRFWIGLLFEISARHYHALLSMAPICHRAGQPRAQFGLSCLLLLVCGDAHGSRRVRLDLMPASMAASARNITVLTSSTPLPPANSLTAPWITSQTSQELLM